MKKIAFFLLIIITLNSCATIYNDKQTIIKISSDAGSKIIFNKDTISINKKQTIIKPYRSKKNIEILVLKDKLEEKFNLESKLSDVFWLNITNFGTGILVDLTNNKRFTYKKHLHFVTDSISKKIVLSNKKVTLLPKNKWLVYTSPIQLLDFLSIPMVNLGTEYFIADNFSLSAEYGIKIADNFAPRNDVIILKDKAINYRFETKFYNLINFTDNVHSNEYIGLELRKIKSQYNDKLEYGFKNNSTDGNFIKDDFGTKKDVTIINIKYGRLVPMGNKFYLDLYYGLGARIKKYEHVSLEYDTNIHQIHDIDDFPDFDFRSFKNNKTFLLNFSLGFKLGIKL